jgi:hypothetical protein
MGIFSTPPVDGCKIYQSVRHKQPLSDARSQRRRPKCTLCQIFSRISQMDEAVVCPSQRCSQRWFVCCSRFRPYDVYIRSTSGFPPTSEGDERYTRLALSPALLIR